MGVRDGLEYSFLREGDLHGVWKGGLSAVRLKKRDAVDAGYLKILPAFFQSTFIVFIDDWT